MEYTQKASIEKKIKNRSMIFICITASISLLGLVMAVYSLIKLKIIFTLIYLVAVILGFLYAVLKINTIIPPYIAGSGGYLYFQTWRGLFPFRTDKGFVGEFLPSKTVLKKVDISEINRIYLGTRNYLLKLVTDGRFKNELIDSKEKHENVVKKMDFIYITTKDNNEIFMSITDFDNLEMAEILKPIVDSNERIDFKCNNRFISKIIPPKRLSF